jgi:hypothetical protein
MDHIQIKHLVLATTSDNGVLQTLGLTSRRCMRTGTGLQANRCARTTMPTFGSY